MAIRRKYGIPNMLDPAVTDQQTDAAKQRLAGGLEGW
jgi:hypothetical protein